MKYKDEIEFGVLVLMLIGFTLLVIMIGGFIWM